MKTIQEGAFEFRKKNFCDGSHLERCSDLSFKAGVEFAQRWYSVEEELPLGTHIIYKNSIGGYSCLYMPNDIDGMKARVEWFGITHWRPIELK